MKLTHMELLRLVVFQHDVGGLERTLLALGVWERSKDADVCTERLAASAATAGIDDAALGVLVDWLSCRVGST